MSKIKNIICNPSGLQNIIKKYQNCSMGELTTEDIILQKKIAERIEFLRLKTGLSQTDFAQKNHIDRQVINRWESVKNARGVTVYSIQKFCKMVNITLKDFFDDDSFNL
ncbi:helix-turn-helix domain-containing protein [Flavobacterium sp. LC2016-23]|uniref:helix-turn-helix domain-containing protein n=1 Tax=Flavobacterium sp. LC2016-23 TaxID=2666330 RepID=UPI001E497305|nr:helix-turn-helix transcriptional regulator [Flavobacterium sp. LC2016-23]